MFVQKLKARIKNIKDIEEKNQIIIRKRDKKDFLNQVQTPPR